ncbi:carbon monoxide dehydrogenase subunit G [Streptomyces sp. MST-110588]|uniref:carbon monoxide dehydrogenase subunit G n=1 Tax=Streptomyces sp. MST-110588 TaxID=2833628 RepID=UPI001F5DD4C9|nr:carbon monoxide dehydrogenase subunit G [Streptomyces sp. MST-110588]UNO41137.1 carbon monoxide dehydrogenase subunit G [Streptomyces sp. MST-110588]
MEHEVFVPFSVGTVRQALGEPGRVARCVPGVQLDADAGPGAPEGRLRLRVGSSTITYRGTLTVSVPEGDKDGEGDGGPDLSSHPEPGTSVAPPAVVVHARGTESRGGGSVDLTLTVRLSASASGPGAASGPAGESGTTLVCSGTVRSEGRLAEATPQAAEATGRRLLDRFAANLATDLTERPLQAPPAAGAPSDTSSDTPSGTPSGAPAGTTSDGPDQPGRPAPADPADPADLSDLPGHPDHAALFEVEVPPPSLDPLTDDELAAVAPAEAAHARRTMIGRSAEEVDHAPPRGRYAPVPAPESASATDTLRWAAPAAAVLLASAVLVGRILRRRR